MLFLALIFFILIFTSPVFGQVTPTLPSYQITPTTTPTPTLTPTPTVVPTPAFSQNPYITEVMPNPSSGNEWVEIYNPNDIKITLTGWYINDSTNSSTNRRSVNNFEINAKSYAVFELDKNIFNNTEDDYVELWNGNNSISRAPSYPSNIGNSSWSRRSSSEWCVTENSKGTENKSCLNPTPTTTPTPTLTPTPTKAPTSTLTPTQTITPTSEPTPTIEVAPTLEPTLASDPSVLGSQTTSSGTTISDDDSPKSNSLGVVFIVAGGILLLSPLIITQIQKWKLKQQ